MNYSNKSVSIRKDNEISKDCVFVKKANFDFYSLYIETPKRLTVLSNLPVHIKEAYHYKNFKIQDPMIRNEKIGLFMINKNEDEKGFSEILENEFGIINKYARSTSIGLTKVSYVLGSKGAHANYNAENDIKIIKFTKKMILKYINEISIDLPEIKYSSLNLSEKSLDRLFVEQIIVKPNYGELSCLSLIKDGYSVKEISELTGYKQNTVNSNLKYAREKLASQKTMGAVMVAINMGWIA